MRRPIRFTILLLMFGLLVIQGPATAYAETQGAGENSPQATEELSSDTSLSSLKIAQATLSPEFAPDQLTYTATVPYEVDRVALTAKTTDPEARKVINGTGDLEVGENTITATVTSEDGSTRIYRILLTRQAPTEGSETTEEGSETQQSPEETAEEASREPVTEPTTQEPTAAEETTTAGGGIVVETDEEKPGDGDDFLDRRTMIILLIAAICLVAIFATVAAIVAFRQRQLDEDDLDEDDLDEDDLDEEDLDDLDEKEAKEKFAELSGEQDDLTDEELFGEDVEFSEVYQQIRRADTDSAADLVLQEIVEELLDRDEDFDEEWDDDDLDDDFELLLEEDDDFDFLDF